MTINQIFKSDQTDLIGVISSGLCLIHCLATPFLFIAQTCSIACCSAAPAWWKGIDLTFLAISLIAVFYSTRNTSSDWIKPALWLSWVMLAAVILNSSLGLGLFPENSFIKYFPALLLISFHLINQKYCRCQESTCCIHR